MDNKNVSKDAVLIRSKLICKSVEANELFFNQHKEAGRVYDLILDLWNYCYDVQIECMREGLNSIWPMLIHVIQSKLYGMLNALLLGDIPTCYVCMRIILEGLVDTAIIGAGRFLELPFPKDLEKLKKLEEKKHISFSEKCELLLPAWVSSKTKKECIKLWKDLSKYWAHSAGIIRKLQEKFEDAIKAGKKDIPPMWALALPYEYKEWDIKDLKELADKLEKLSAIAKELLKPFAPSN